MADDLADNGGFGISPALGGSVFTGAPQVTSGNGGTNGLFTSNPTSNPNIGSFIGSENAQAASSFTNIGGPAASATNIVDSGTAPTAAGGGAVSASPTASGGDLLNSAGSSGSAGSSSSSAISGVTFLDNVANNYHQFTYHIQLYSTPEGSGATGTKCIIAESGVTGFNITSLTLDSSIGPSQANGVAFMSTFTMVITEPLGSSFTDALQAAAIQTNTSNWQKSTFYLSLSFKAYDESGNPVGNVCSTWPNGGVWSYSIFIGVIKCHVTAAGGHYTLIGSMTHDQGITNNAMARHQQVITPKGQSLGEYLTEYVKQLNASPVNKGLYTYAVKYGQGQLPDPQNFKFTENPTMDVAIMRGMAQEDRNKSVGSHPPGTLIIDAIVAAIGSTVEGQKYIVSSDGSLPAGATSANGKYRAAGLYRVYSEVVQGSYNSQFNQYAQSITYHIKGAVHQGTSIDNSESDGTKGAPALAAVTKYNGVKKRYMYYFTGLNTEVLELDVDFNVAGVNALPSVGGANYFTDNVRPGAAFRKTASAGAASPLSSISALAGSGATLLNNVGSALSSGSFANALSSAGAAATSAAGISASASSIAASSAGSFGGLLSQVGAATTQVASLVNNVSALTNKLSSLAGASSATTGASGGLSGNTYIEDTSEVDNATMLKISTIETHNLARQAAGSGTPTQGNTGKSVFGSILNQLTAATSLMNINHFKIKGDPYWLGFDYQTMLSNTDTSGTLPDFTQGDVCFLLRMQFPYNWEETGTTTFRPSEVFTGIYRAKSIKHEFNNGAYTQSVTAMRMTEFASDDAAAMLAASSVVSSSGATAGAPSNAAANGVLTVPNVGGYVSGLGSLISNLAGTTLTTAQSK